MFRLSGILLLAMALACAACRRSGGEGAVQEGKAKHQAHSPRKEAERGAVAGAGKGSHRDEGPSLPEPEAGMVTLGASALDHLYPICSDHDGKLNEDVAMKLGLSYEECQALDPLTRELAVRAKKDQIEPLGPLDFQVGRAVIIPPLALEKIEACVADFAAALPDHLPEASSRLMVQMYRKRLDVEFGDEMSITLRNDAGFSIQDLRGDQDMLGVKFAVSRKSDNEGRPMHYSYYQHEGSRFDFLKVPPGVKGTRARDFTPSK